MIDHLVALIVQESKWLTLSMTLAVLLVAGVCQPWQNSFRKDRRQVQRALNLFFGVMIT